MNTLRCFLLVSIAALSGCGLLGGGSGRLTRELIIPANTAEEKDYMVIEWPSGVKASDIKTFEVTASNGEKRANSVTVLPPMDSITSGSIRRVAKQTP